MKYLNNPEVFKVNRLDAHSNHNYYVENKNFKISLNGIWDFSYCGGMWTYIKVPGHMELQGFGNPHYVNTMYPWDGHEDLQPGQVPCEFNPYGEYKRKIAIPNDWHKSPVFISFQGCESCLELYLNGEFVGYSEDSFTPSEFDITNFLLSGENEITIKVYKWCSGSWLEDQDFWRFSGIFRDVYLYTIPEVHIEDLFLTSNINLNDKTALLKNKLKLKYLDKINVNLKVTLLDTDNNEVVSIEENNIINEEITISLNANNINLWSAEYPYLYTVLITIKDSKTGKVIQNITQKFGFRKFELVNKIMKINGERIVFKGVNRHEFNCNLGRAITEEDMLWDIKFLKANNFNAVRCSHYPNSSRWYELCDEYGIYVIDEVNLESHGTWQIAGQETTHKVIPSNNPIWLKNILDRAESTFQNHKNHCSILIWSCGNESHGGENIYKMSEYFRSVDTSRLVHYEGVFWDRSFNNTSDMESRMYSKPWEVESYLDNNPTKPFILCEYSHSMGNSNGAIHKYIELADKYEMYQGGFIWDYIDQAITKNDENGNKYLAYGGDYNDRPTDYNFCGNGLVFANRVPTPKVQEVKQLYSNFKIKPFLDSVVIENNNLFTNLSQYEVRWKLLYNGLQILNGTIQGEIPPLSKDRLNLNIPKQSISGEYTVDVSIHLKNSTKWADIGHEIAFGQYVYIIGYNEVKETGGNFRCVEGDINVGIKGEGFSIIFSKIGGGLVSLNYAGEEFINRLPRPNFWRSPVDNDRGNNMPSKCSKWKIASLYGNYEKFKLVKHNDKVEIIYNYNLNIGEGVCVQLKYSVLDDGSITVTMNYKGYSNLSNIPAFGMNFNLKSDFNNIKWYGLGPDENYIDRCHGARLGIYNTSTHKNLTRYLVPQECGNRTGVRWATITRDNGIGLKVSSKTPFEISALPYTINEIEEAQHHFELPKSHCTSININKIQMGVGGDDTWGALVHHEYLIQSDKEMTFTFKIEHVHN